MPVGRPSKRPGDGLESALDAASGSSKSKLPRLERGPEDFSSVVKSKLQSYSRTGQACDRCKVCYQLVLLSIFWHQKKKKRPPPGPSQRFVDRHASQRHHVPTPRKLGPFSQRPRRLLRIWRLVLSPRSNPSTRLHRTTRRAWLTCRRDRFAKSAAMHFPMVVHTAPSRIWNVMSPIE